MNLTRRTFVSASAMGAASLLSLALFGCGSSQSSPGGSGSAGSSEGFPVTIKHAYGETTIEKKPERVVTIFWNNYEPVLAMGIAPVGISKPNFGKVDSHGLRPWISKAYKKLGADYPVLFDDTDGVDLEAVNDCQPDIVLAPYSGISKDEYKKLSEIAPVVPFEKVAYEAYWRDIVRTDAKALGMSSDGEKIIKDTESLIKKKSEQYGVSGKKCASIWFDAGDLSKFSVYMPWEVRVDYLKDLGLELPDSVKALAKKTDQKDGFFVTLSSEKADQFSDVQTAVIFGDKDLLAQAQSDKLLSAIPAIKNGSVALLTADGYLQAAAVPCVLGIEATIDDYLKVLSEALQKVKA